MHVVKHTVCLGTSTPHDFKRKLGGAERAPSAQSKRAASAATSGAPRPQAPNRNTALEIHRPPDRHLSLNFALSVCYLQFMSVHFSTFGYRVPSNNFLSFILTLPPPPAPLAPAAVLLRCGNYHEAIPCDRCYLLSRSRCRHLGLWTDLRRFNGLVWFSASSHLAVLVARGRIWAGFSCHLEHDGPKSGWVMMMMMMTMMMINQT